MGERAVNTDSISEIVAERIKNSSQPRRDRFSGAFCGPVREPVPAYSDSESEDVMQGKHNSWIVFGRDRPGSKASGYGGRGHTQCGSIDMVVGRMGRYPKERDAKGELITTSSNFTTDSARIYISQKTDIDKNFRLVAGQVGQGEGLSGIGIKADHVRVIGRSGIKLVTNTDVEDSQGGEILSTHGIDLIAGNNDAGLQPMVLGHYLIDSLLALTSYVEDLSDIIHQLILAQSQYNLQLQEHIHIVPLAGPTIMVGNIPLRLSNGQTSLTNLKLDTAILANMYNFQAFKSNYLIESGDGWILSRANNVN